MIRTVVVGVLSVQFLLVSSCATPRAKDSQEEHVQGAIESTLQKARNAVEEHGVTDAAMKQIQVLLAELAQVEGLRDRPDMKGLHGSKSTQAIVLATEGDDGLTLILARFAPNEPTPIHDHGTWAVLHVLEGRDRYLEWERLDDGSDSEHADLKVKLESTLKPGDSVYWYGPPRDIHSQVAQDGPACELILAGANMMTKARHYFDGDSGRVTTTKPQ